MNRRDLLKLIVGTPLAMSPLRLYAVPGANARVLVVFMRGAYDAANLLVPITSSFYYEARPNIAVPKEGAAANSALPLDSDWGLHPALRHSLLPLFQKRQLAFVPFAGTDDLSRSHFETQETIELGQAHDRTRNYQSGFLNRLASVLAKDAAAIAFTDQLPAVFRGDVQIPNMALRQLNKPGINPRLSGVIADMYQN